MRVLLIEDDQRLTTALGESLRSEGYAVDVVGTAEDGRWMATEVPYDTIVLDVGLPDGDGIDLCAALRDGGVWAPILVLTARAEIRDRVRGLDAGADDYLAKPFSFDELIARVRALLRRGQVERPSILTVGSMRLDPATRRVSVDRQPLPITGRAFAILELLARRKGQLVTRAEIMEHVWDWAWDGVSNVIDVHVSALRAILREAPGAPVIETVRGAGFRPACPGRPRERALYMTIRTRLTIWYGLTFMLLIGVAGVVVWWQVEASLRASTEEALRIHAIDVAGALRRSSTAIHTWSPPSRASSRPWLIRPPVRSMPAPVRRRG